MFKEIRDQVRVDFSACIPFRITDHNYGDHVANNVFVEYLHEGRVQLLNSLGYTELDLEGSALTMSELHVKYTKQAYYPDSLRLDMTIGNIRPTRFDISYKGFNSADELLLLAKCEMAAINLDTGKPIRLPTAFADRFE